MNHREFENLIRAERSRSLPSCPANLEANVMRRLRMAESPAEDVSAFGWILALLPRKAASLGFVALVAVLSVFSSVQMTSTTLRAAETRDLAADSLDFGVFNKTSILNFER
ncbi:hypothetical protein QEH52_18105 [Coraliomargarita sp. SDUM461003]|uniref:Uncharacterized protein n=1 Tax=Thalassobacterium maritimum TaxID=3041265 RepID=A0ABU1AZ58_9BACT|nr:hypothetical protein [Coraliomargarita sp. SDUM461003]